MIDSIVVIVFSVFILLVGVSFSRTGTNLKSFFAGGEAVPWTIAGLSLFMSFFSAGTFVAWGSIAYEYGWVAITIQWTMCLGALVTGILLAPKWKATGNLTAAEFIKERLGENVQKIFAYIFMFVSLFIKGSVLYSVSKLVGVSLGYPLVPVTIILGVLMISYTAVGGLWAVMVTDILQFVILTAGVIIIIPLVFSEIGGIQAFLTSVPDTFFEPVNAQYSWGFIFAFAIYHIFYIGGNWTFVQRYTSVKNPQSASKVAYLFAALYLISPVLWMIPPMVYQGINPGMTGIQTEDAYIMLCKEILPAGLLGLMLTGMYFSTSASANTTLNVVAAVFTNDIYKNNINPNATDKQLIKVARTSSWLFGFGMIIVALIVPYIGGLVEFTLSVGAITGGPLLLPPIWALFSKRLTGKATLFITLISLTTNLVFKLVLPFINGYKLSRANEMIVGVLLPFFLLLFFEIYATVKKLKSVEYEKMTEARKQRIIDASQPSELEKLEILKQNKFGLKMISFSLFFISILLYILSLITKEGTVYTIIVATIILLSAIMPFIKSRKIIIKS